jgi:predicted transcriptional regulator
MINSELKAKLEKKISALQTKLDNLTEKEKRANAKATDEALKDFEEKLEKARAFVAAAEETRAKILANSEKAINFLEEKNFIKIALENDLNRTKHKLSKITESDNAWSKAV